ncbi:MAG: hypothetical protein UD963_06595, partial [Christensenellales bacterium]|nr:hypothetical protein [Christensenellales bacterium]
SKGRAESPLVGRWGKAPYPPMLRYLLFEMFGLILTAPSVFVMDRACAHGVFRTLAEGISPIFSGDRAEMRRIGNENQKKSKI